jgi:deoxyribonuclease-1
MGHHNPFVIGEREWSQGHRNHAEGIVTVIPAGHPARVSTQPAVATSQEAVLPIRGNRNSKIYHLPVGCPSYDRVSRRGIVDDNALLAE